jgi:hypothetical protein
MRLTDLKNTQELSETKKHERTNRKKDRPSKTTKMPSSFFETFDTDADAKTLF